MALDMQERHAFEHEEGRSPVWIGMAWGAVSLLGGAALLAAMLTFDVREIGWSYLNGSGLVIPDTSNVLGTAGLYGAGIFYWMLGAMAWMLVILLEWWRATHSLPGTCPAVKNRHPNNSRNKPP